MIESRPAGTLGVMLDADTIRAAAGGDLLAQAALVDLWLPRVLAWCRRLGGVAISSEDAAQDVFVVALGRLGELRDPQALPAWMFAITRNVVRSRRRRAWVARWVGLAEREDPGPGPALTAELRQAAVRFGAALDALPAEQREAVVLVDVEGCTAGEAARLTGVAEGTVRSRLRLARARLRRRTSPDEARAFASATLRGVA